MIITIQLDVSTEQGRAALEAAMLAMTAPKAPAVMAAPVSSVNFMDAARDTARRPEISGAFDSAGRPIESIIPAPQVPAAPPKAPTAPPKAPTAPPKAPTAPPKAPPKAPTKAPTFADLMQAIAKSGLNDAGVNAAVSSAGASSLMDAATNPAMCQAIYDQVLANDIAF